MAATGQSILGNNMFAYCNNNPILFLDSTGARAVINHRGNEGGCDKPIDEALHLVNNWAVNNGIATDFLGACFLGFYQSSPGIYHANTYCGQALFGYNDLYDKLFNIGTNMRTEQFLFSHDGAEYVIWAWKGDYINLGAGAEMGIYRGGPNHWFSAVGSSMPMSLSLSLNGKNIISHSQNTWWITGFNSNYLNIHSGALTAMFTIDFSENPTMFDSFSNTHGNTSGWSFNAQSHTAIYVF